MLAALWFASGAAGVHQKERSFGVERNGCNDFAAVVLKNFIDKKITADNHRRFRGSFPGITAPDEDLVDFLAFFFGVLDGDVGVAFVIDPLAVAPVAIGVDQNAAAGVRGTRTAGFAAESGADHRAYDAEPGASEHDDTHLPAHRPPTAAAA